MKCGIVLGSLVVFACANCSVPTSGEHIATREQPFSSREAVLVDFEFDGRIVADVDEPGAVRRQIEAQLMYSIGQLNGDRSVGRHERLELSAITAARSSTLARIDPPLLGRNGPPAKLR